MLKKLIFIVLFSFCVGGIFYSYLTLENKTHLNTPVINCVPKNAAFLLHAKKPISLWTSLSETNLIWDNLKEIESVKEFDNNLKEIDSIIHELNLQKEKEITLSIHQGVESPNYLVAFSSNIEENSILNKNLNADQNSSYKNIPILKSKEKTLIYTCFLSPFTLISTSENTIQNSIDQLTTNNHLLKDTIFNKLYRKRNKASNLQLYYNTSNLKKIAIPYLNKKTIENWETKGDWGCMDVIIDNNQILINGLTTTTSSTKKEKPTKRIDISLLPTSLQSIFEYSFDIENLSEKQRSYLNNNCNCNIANSTKNWIGNHITTITFGDNEKAYYLEINENEHLIDQISELISIDSNIISSYGKLIYKIDNRSLNTLLNLTKEDPYFCIHNNQLVISTIEGLKRLSFEWKKNKHTKPSFNYSSFSEEHLAQKANFNWFTTTKHLSQLINTALKNEYKSTPENIIAQLKNHLQIGYQTNALNSNLEHTAAIIKSESNRKSENNSLWELTLETPSNTVPQLLKNHKSKSLDIFIQDSTNDIHLINAVGRIKWTKNIEDKIIGQVQQIDIYGNNKFQLLFNTKSHIHVLDINGKYVKGYPVKLDSKATSSVSIFDYEKTSNYRFWISCENHTIYNYDKEGKKVTGWSLPKSIAPISKQFKRTIFNNKDYIYSIDTLGKVYFFNRRGESIYSINQTLNAKNKNITLQKRASLTTSSFIYQEDSSYQLIDYSLSNNSQVIILDELHPQFAYKILDIDNNKFIDYLAIYQNKIELYGIDKSIIRKVDFLTNIEHNHVLSKSINNNNYIITKEEGKEQINILDSHLKQLNNNPIIGSLKVTIGDINSDGKLDIVTIINNETIKVYSLN